VTRAVRRCLSLLLAVLLGIPSVGQAQVIEYYHLDALGSVRAVTNQAGQVVERHDYLAYGEECTTGPCAGNPAGTNTFKFTGKERDQESGLDYFGARYYGSRIGRFTGVDPALALEKNIVDPQRWNRYANSLNNPLKFVDPDGRLAVIPLIIFLTAAFVLNNVNNTNLPDGPVADHIVPESYVLTAGYGGLAGGARGAIGAVIEEGVGVPLSPKSIKALVPRGARRLGEWGEARLAAVLRDAGVKPAKPFATSLGPRYVDRLVDGVAHEAKGGIDVRLNSKIQRQIDKDVELIASGQVRGAHWHFFQGADPELLTELRRNGIDYTVHPMPID
jgi:RHS repeat-associated protein